MNNILLIDALHINDSGGKILLKYLIDSIEKSKLKVIYLIDDRVKEDLFFLNTNNVFFLKANFLNRFLFYLRNKNKFSKVFCFANVPPPISMNASVYTYFHNKLLLFAPKELSILAKLSLNIKSLVVKYLADNTDSWIVQTQVMKVDLLRKNPNLSQENIIIHPFYPQQILNIKKKIIRVPLTYLYVSSYNRHKNYENLLDAFELFYDKFKKGELHLTLKNDDSKIIKKINGLVKDGYPIINHGYLDRNSLKVLYRQSEFVIFPSLIESFGLGILEGIENGCKIIGADLRYTHAVCKPTYTFDPRSSISILKALEKSIINEYHIDTIQSVSNDINGLLEKLKS